MSTQLPLVALESVVVGWDKLRINLALEFVAPDVHVIGSRPTEDGYELVLEGDAAQVTEFINLFKEGESK